eukprot:sb/3472373/
MPLRNIIISKDHTRNRIVPSNSISANINLCSNFSAANSNTDLAAMLMQKATLSSQTEMSMSEEMMIPQNKVGLIIGKGGESIKELQNKAGCRMQMIQEGVYANAPEKPLKMIGSPAAIQKARLFRTLGKRGTGFSSLNPRGCLRGLVRTTIGARSCPQKTCLDRLDS